MSDNVILLGAGASYDAGVPLLSGFVDQMWEYALKKHNGQKPLSSGDIEIFERAIRVRNELDQYHGRVTFDDRNIEDILSLLVFNMMEGKRSNKKKFDWIIEAISRTIELSCNIIHPGLTNKIVDSEINVYKDFWAAIFRNYDRGSVPTIISFNYDLVLERSLFQTLTNTIYNYSDNVLPFYNLRLKYYFDTISEVEYSIQSANYSSGYSHVEGTLLSRGNNPGGNYCDIELLKLHGSLNFPRKEKESNYNLTETLLNPYILPPVFNKLSNSVGKETWKVALKRLRNAKNLIIVGYSLPESDIYMQYFLKSALGPNINLNKVFIYNPALTSDNETSRKMKERFRSCFSEQLSRRVFFNPDKSWVKKDELTYGTFESFVWDLHYQSEKLLF